MKKFAAITSEEKWPRINGKMTDFFPALYMYIKN